MTKSKPEQKVGKKWKSYITGIITTNFMSFNKIDKYFRNSISESTVKAIQENWIRLLGIDYEIISVNICKENKPLGIGLEGRNELSRDAQEVIQHHVIRVIKPHFCIADSHKLMVKDELLEISGLKVLGLPTKELIRTMKRLPNYFQIVVARSMHHNYDLASDYGESEDNINSTSFYDINSEESSIGGTLRSVTSNYSTTSRDFGSSVSFGGEIDGQHQSVQEYLRNIVGWRGPIVLEFRKEKERLGLQLEEISDPKSCQIIIVFKLIIPNMLANRDGRLHVGDRLLQVNGKQVAGTPFRKVCQWIKSAPGGRLVICTCKPHFAPIHFDNCTATLDDTDFYNTLADSNKLPKLSEETEEVCELQPIPEYFEKQLCIKRTGDKLGIFLDLMDNGRHGSRVKKISRGLAKTDGTLREGDYITNIGGISLRVTDKIQMDHNLKNISQDTHDYIISYITAEDISLYKKTYTLTNKVPNPIQSSCPPYPKLGDVSKEYEKVRPSKLSFRTFDISIENDHCTNLGLVICPSLKEPSRYVSIMDIHENSLTHKSGLLKVNDDILMVNGISFEKITSSEAGRILKSLVQNENEHLFNFKIRRLTNTEKEFNSEFPIEDSMPKLLQFPDIYHCFIKKRNTGYGFSIIDVDDRKGSIVEKIDPSSSASQVYLFKSGDRFGMINGLPVCSLSKLKIMEIVKSSTTGLDLVMEIPKYREFSVTIEKDSSISLGLNIAGGIDTKSPIPVIESLVPNKKSKFSEELYSGDLIIKVDDNDMHSLSHSQVIHILRSTGTCSVFKIYRQLPYIYREIFENIDDFKYPHNYIQSSRYSVSIHKPVDSITTFGITFTDVVILDESNDFKVIDRYKAVLSVDNLSLAEKYAPQIEPFHFLVSVNQILVDCDITCDDLKEIIDTGSWVNLLFSRDIPYKVEQIIKDHDSPILLLKNDGMISHSDNSSEEDLLISQTNCDNLVDITIESTELKASNSFVEDSSKLTENYVEPIHADKANLMGFVNMNKISSGTETSLIDVDNLVTKDNSEICETQTKECTGSCNSINSPKYNDQLNVNNRTDIPRGEIDNENFQEVQNSIFNGNENLIKIHDLLPKNENPNINVELVESNYDWYKENLIEFEMDDNHSSVQNSGEIPEKTFENDSEVNENTSTTSSNSKEHSSDIRIATPELMSEFGINIDYIKVHKFENVELGFQVYGGPNAGPNRETIPIFVIGVEKRTCNWHEDQDEPLLKNGYQLIELNGHVLSNLRLSEVETLIKEAKDDLIFKVITIK